MSEIVSRVYIEVDGETIEASSIDESITGNKEPVKVMNRRNRAISHHHGVPDISLSVAFPMDMDLNSKFLKMLSDNTRFTTVVEAEGEAGTSKYTSYLDCEIYQVGRAGREGGTQEITLEIGALDYVES